ASQWLRSLWSSRKGRTSLQALREFYNVVTRKTRPGLPRETAQALVRDLLTWNPADDNPVILNSAWQVEDRYGLSFWDSLIVASAMQQGCAVLLTEDLQHGQVFEGLITVKNPFIPTE
ncbi:MAG: PIN domain-containing protein, partial [Acidithiobacillus sp.]